MALTFRNAIRNLTKLDPITPALKRNIRGTAGKLIEKSDIGG